MSAVVNDVEMSYTAMYKLKLQRCRKHSQVSMFIDSSNIAAITVKNVAKQALIARPSIHLALKKCVGKIG